MLLILLDRTGLPIVVPDELVRQASIDFGCYRPFWTEQNQMLFEVIMEELEKHGKEQRDLREGR